MSEFGRPQRVSEVTYNKNATGGRNPAALRKDGDRVNQNDYNAFLDRCNPSFRSSAAQLFHDACVGGATNPGEVVSSVRRDALQKTPTHRRGEEFAQLAQALQTDGDAAMRFAAWAIEWNRMTPDERAREKAQRGEDHRQAHMATLPMTEKQQQYLVNLGARELSYSWPQNRAEASALIERITRERRQ